jgi:hypothetical protein
VGIANLLTPTSLLSRLADSELENLESIGRAVHLTVGFAARR